MSKEFNTDFIEKLSSSQYGFKDPEKYVFKTQKGLSPSVVGQISEIKKEPQWMYEFRLKALEHFLKMPLPGWGPDLSGLDLDDLYYYVRPM